MGLISAHERLAGLPKVFTTLSLPGLLRIDRKSASVYLARWRRKGFVSSLGPRIGVHFNLLLDPQAKEVHYMDAIAHVFPGAMVAGVSAIHGAGWTTQCTQSVEIMVPTRPSLPRVHGAALATRPKDWFGKARSRIQRPGPVPMVSAAYALADCWRSGCWRPDPDDLEWDMIPVADLQRAFDDFGLTLPESWKDWPDFGWTGGRS